MRRWKVAFEMEDMRLFFAGMKLRRFEQLPGHFGDLGRLILILVVCFWSLPLETDAAEVIYAMNAGGEAHTDVYGVRYERDPLQGKVGTASDYGKQLLISRVSPNDQILYQTERYHTSDFGYSVPIHSDGDYVIILKFCEVYFTSPQLKVFDVVLNDGITVISELDIYDRVGRGVAHDEYILVTVADDKLIFDDEAVEFNGRLQIDFKKGSRDNPKINAIIVVKGTLDDVPKLPPIPQESDDEIFKGDQEDDVVESKTGKVRHTSGPKTPDPYSMYEGSTMLPIFIAIGAFIPLVFCLCKL